MSKIRMVTNEAFLSPFFIFTFIFYLSPFDFTHHFWVTSLIFYSKFYAFAIWFVLILKCHCFIITFSQLTCFLLGILLAIFQLASLLIATLHYKQTCHALFQQSSSICGFIFIFLWIFILCLHLNMYFIYVSCNSSTNTMCDSQVVLTCVFLILFPS